MIRFLEFKGYRVIPVEDFRCDSDYWYKRSCSALKQLAYSNYDIGWHHQAYMLIKVLNPNGQPICQIAELPGFFLNDSFKNKFPAYIDALIRSGNKKFWIFFIEQGWGYVQDRNIYIRKKYLNYKISLRQKTKLGSCSINVINSVKWSIRQNLQTS